MHRVLQRRGVSRLRDADRVTLAPVRYVACHPGALLHQDHKKLGRIPDGGGWRALGRANRSHDRVRTTGYEHLEVLVDDAPWIFVVHDLNPRALSPKVKGFVQPQSWFVDVTSTSVVR